MVAALSSMLPAIEACPLPMRERCRLSMRVNVTAPSTSEAAPPRARHTLCLAHNAQESRPAAFASDTMAHSLRLAARSRRWRTAFPALRFAVLR